MVFSGCEGSNNSNKGNSNYLDELSPSPSNVRFTRMELLKQSSSTASNTFHYVLKISFFLDVTVEGELPILFLLRNNEELYQQQLTEFDITQGYLLLDIQDEIRENSIYTALVNKTETIKLDSRSVFNALSDSVVATQNCNQPDRQNPQTQWSTHNYWNGTFTSIPTDENYIAEGSCRSLVKSALDAESDIESQHCRPIQAQLPFFWSLAATDEASLLLPLYSQVNVLWPDKTKHLQPNNGWPVVIYFHGAGSGLNCEQYHTAGINIAGEIVRNWVGHHNAEAEAIMALRDAGYAIVLPHAPVGLPPFYHGNWITSVIEDYQPYQLTADFAFLNSLLTHIDNGKFAALANLDGDNLFAAGFSLGATQSVRMSIAWPGRFNAIAVNNGGPANCLWVGYDDPLFPQDWCNNILLPDVNNSPTPVLLTHQLEDRNQMVGQSELYAFYLEQLNQHRIEDQQPIPWRAVIGRLPENQTINWVLSQHPQGMTSHWSETTLVPECNHRDELYCVEYVEHIYVKDTYHYVIEQAGEVMVDWFNHYKK